MRNLEELGDAFTRACECGCGDPVPLLRGDRGDRGNPARFVNPTHYHWARDRDDVMSAAAVQKATKEAQHVADGDVPIEKFREALRSIKRAKGLTWDQVAEQGGVQRGQINAWMFSGDRYRWVNYETARTFLLRMAGGSTPATAYERRVAPKLVGKTTKTIKHIGMDPDTPTYKAPDWALYAGKTYQEKRAATAAHKKQQQLASVAQFG